MQHFDHTKPPSCDRSHGCDRSHSCDRLIELFDHTFVPGHGTCLVGGGEEPVYEPASAPGQLHRIIFTRDYFASALHEVAHWCVAGPERRRQPDYGYWYSPDGRSAAQQAEFERVEVRPQALEWLFSEAAGWRFRVSADNLELASGPSEGFKNAIHDQVLNHCRQGVSGRVGAFLEALMDYYRTAPSLEALLRPQRFAREAL